MIEQLTAKITKQLNAHRERYVASWRGWVAALAAGEQGPTPGDVLEVAVALGVPDPAASLQRDVKVMHSVQEAERRAQQQDDRMRELLAPWDGDVERLKAEYDSAAAESKRLGDLYRQAVLDTGAAYWRSVAHRTKESSPHLFGEWPEPRRQGSELSSMEVFHG